MFMFSLFVACSTKLKTKNQIDTLLIKILEEKKKKKKPIMKTMTSLKQINLQIFKALNWKFNFLAQIAQAPLSIFTFLS
jgi:hypothetical protein